VIDVTAVGDRSHSHPELPSPAKEPDKDD
jgi:hypothetical protein